MDPWLAAAYHIGSGVGHCLLASPCDATPIDKCWYGLQGKGSIASLNIGTRGIKSGSYTHSQL